MLIRLHLFLTSLLLGRPAVLVPAPAAGRRGATFIEYLLLAGIAIVLGAVIYTALGGSFDTILRQIRNALDVS